MQKNEVTIGIALVAVLFGGLIGWFGKPKAVPPPPPVTVAPVVAPLPPVVNVQGVPQAEVELRMSMRRLWEDHVTWTRLYILDVAGGLKEKDATAARLLKNQEDIGNAIKPIYGDAAGDQLTALLKTHILGAVDVLAAAKSKNAKKQEEAVKTWYTNGDDIAQFLNKANPQFWPEAEMKTAMKMHLDTTLTEAIDVLSAKHEDGVKDYDAVKDHIYLMSDMLSDGIVKQFPEKFK